MSKGSNREERDALRRLHAGPKRPGVKYVEYRNGITVPQRCAGCKSVLAAKSRLTLPVVGGRLARAF